MSETKYKLEKCYINDHIYLKWRGKYTVGDVSIRGTRVWLQSTCAEAVHLYYMNAKEIQEKIDDETNDFPGDYINLREISLKKIIEHLTSTSTSEHQLGKMNQRPTNSYRVELWSLKDLVTQDIYDLYSNDKEFLEKEQLIIVDYGCMMDNGSHKIPQVLYIINDLKNILGELNKVLKFAIENHVTWIWV